MTVNCISALALSLCNSVLLMRHSQTDIESLNIITHSCWRYHFYFLTDTLLSLWWLLLSRPSLIITVTITLILLWALLTLFWLCHPHYISSPTVSHFHQRCHCNSLSLTITNVFTVTTSVIVNLKATDSFIPRNRFSICYSEVVCFLAQPGVINIYLSYSP